MNFVRAAMYELSLPHMTLRILKRSRQLIVIALMATTLIGCASQHARVAHTTPPPCKPCRPKQQGIASWYGSECKHTASGERYDPMSLTAAHRSLPFGTMVRVTNVRTNCCAVVRINNRGPFTRGRIIDVSKAAAMQLKMIGSGIAKVELEILERPESSARRKKVGS